MLPNSVLIWLFLCKVLKIERLENSNPKRLVARIAGFVACLALLMPGAVSAQEKHVLVLSIRDEIDTRMARYVELALREAEDTKADIVLIDMDTYGGMLTDAKDIVDKLMQVKKPVWVFINTDAASAGALISIACDSIYMAPGASIGAATVVTGNGERAPDKYQSYMRSIMRSTAQENGRNPTIAEAMVDENVELDSIKKPGQVITFSTDEAIRHGYCEGKVTSIDSLLRQNHITHYTLHRFELSVVDSTVNFFMNPFISGILILFILGGIYFELQAPGLGLAGLLALIALVLYLVPYYLNGLAENWEILTLLAGIALIGVELFLIPGFGVAGIAGITLTLGSLVLIMINNDAFDFSFVPTNDMLLALIAALGGMVGSMVLLFAGSARIMNSRAFRRVALTDTQDSTQGYTANFNQTSMAGKQGVAHTVLRPSGKVTIDGQVYDAFTRGEYIEPGEAIEVIDNETTSLKVRKR
jgi:membrane-bound serine protease (ClpP class)